MRTLDYILLSVANPTKSETLYSALLGLEPAQRSPSFVLYVLPNGVKLGLWIDSEIQPTPKPAGGIEVSFTEEGPEAVLATYKEWSTRAKIVQEPTQMDFGFTFVAEDLDGHRLRVHALSDDPS